MGRWHTLAMSSMCALALLVSSHAAMDKALAQPAPAKPAEETRPTVLLDGHSVWRIYQVLKPPLVELDTGLTPITSKYEWLDRDTAPAPADWTKPDFSDATWLRDDAKGAARTPYLASLHARARFEVTDLSRAKDLKLSVAYYGGVIVYLNGKEITRASVSKTNNLADSYPLTAFATQQGELIPGGWVAANYKEAMAARERKLDNLTIPAAALRQGVNVLALEIVRAPYHKVVYDYWQKNAAKDRRELKDKNLPYDLSWNTCELRDVTLTSDGSAGLVPNAARSKELQAWNSDLLTADVAGDRGDRCEPLRPVSIKGPRNGWSSGKVVLGSSQPIESLKVTCSPLAQGAATIPASQIRARYGTVLNDGPSAETPLNVLLEKPLDSFPVIAGGSVVPVWLTLKIPAGAQPGIYTGQVTIEAKGQKPLAVPLQLQVAPFSVPDGQDYRTFIELMQSPDTLAAEYKVPLWSDKHWQLVNDSLRYIGEIGSKVVQIPLIAQTNSGNEQSMVRFIKKADGTCDYDFSIMDKYLDLVQKNMGKPQFVAFTAWEIYLDTPQQEVTLTDKEKQQKDSEFTTMEKSWAAARWELRGKGPAVTAIDPATRQISTINLPRFEDPAAKPIWKPLFDALRSRMAARGLEKTMLLGMASDRWASTPEMKVLQEVSGNLPWINHTHGGGHVGSKLNGIAPVAYTAYVWNNEYPNDPSKGRNYGWKRPELFTEFRRFTAYNDWPLTSVMLFSEIQITGKQRGLGRIGADFWPVIKDKRGARRGWVWDKYPQSKWHSCNLMSHMLLPGPDGPVATPRYEALREGIQICEARIAIESALTDETLKAKLDPALADRCQKLLDDRVWEELKAFTSLQLTGRVYVTYTSYGNVFYYGAGGTPGHCWYVGSGWQDRTQQLYTLAGEVQKALAAGK